VSPPGRRVVLVSGAPGSGIGGLITVDTTGPVDVAAVADRVRACWRAPVWRRGRAIFDNTGVLWPWSNSCSS